MTDAMTDEQPFDQNRQADTDPGVGARPASGHTVEKIGGTSIRRARELLRTIFIGERELEALYGRVFVVSAFAGMTDLLLEHKRNAEPGVFRLFSDSDEDWLWAEALSRAAEHMCRIHADILEHPEDVSVADVFVRERIEGARSCLLDLQRLSTYGHFRVEDQLDTVREMLAGLGEAHSAYVTTLLLVRRGVRAQFVDLTGWRNPEMLTLDALIRERFEGLNLRDTLPIVTGYASCSERLFRTYDRGYTEITFSRIASLTGAREAIIHKEFHLSSADPRIVGVEAAVPIGNTNYDVADQLSNLGMEAIHPGAAAGLRRSAIPLRVRNAFEPEHMGTLIEDGYRADSPSVEIVAGRSNVIALEFFCQDMVGDFGYDRAVMEIIERHKLRVITKETDANSITNYLKGSLKTIKRACADLEARWPEATVTIRKVAVVCAIGSDLNVPGLLAACVDALARAEISILAIHQSIRSVDIKFIVSDEDHEAAVKALHAGVVAHDQSDSLQQVA